MTEAEARHVDAATDPARPPGVAAPLTTRIGSLVVMAGVLIQASIAGGFLAGHDLNDIHMIVGIPLLLSAIVLVVSGFVGRRKTETTSVLVTRLGVLVAILLTALAGLLAGQGARDLLIAHIPLAIISMGLSARLFGAAG